MIVLDRGDMHARAQRQVTTNDTMQITGPNPTSSGGSGAAFVAVHHGRSSSPPTIHNCGVFIGYLPDLSGLLAPYFFVPAKPPPERREKIFRSSLGGRFRDSSTYLPALRERKF
jgi:hypothetical protein